MHYAELLIEFALLRLRRYRTEQEERIPRGRALSGCPSRKWNMRAVGALRLGGVVALAVIVAFSCQVGLLQAASGIHSRGIHCNCMVAQQTWILCENVTVLCGLVNRAWAFPALQVLIALTQQSQVTGSAWTSEHSTR